MQDPNNISYVSTDVIDSAGVAEKLLGEEKLSTTTPYSPSMVPTTFFPADAVNNLDAKGLAQIHHAAQTGDQQCLAALIQIGANVNIRDSQGRTILHHAASHGHFHLFTQLVLELRVPIDAQDNLGCTALYKAVECKERSNLHTENDKYVMSVKELLRLAANPYLLNYEGLAPIHLAESFGKWEILDLLIADRRKKFPVPENLKLCDQWDKVQVAYRAIFSSHLETPSLEEKSYQLQTKISAATEGISSRKIEYFNELATEYISLLNPSHYFLTEILILRGNAQLLYADFLAENPSSIRKSDHFKDLINPYEEAMKYIGIAFAQFGLYAATEKGQFQELSQIIHMQAQRIIIRYVKNVCGITLSICPILPYEEMRQELNARRKHMKKILEEKSVDVENLAAENTDFFKRFAENIWKNSLSIVCKQPLGAHALICLGSFSHGEMAPFSDFEFAILRKSLLNAQLDQQEKITFRFAAGVMYLFVTALGETGVEQIKFANGFSCSFTYTGFHFDVGGGDSCMANNPVLNPRYIATVDEFVSLHDMLEKELVKGYDDLNRLILLSSGFVTGDESIHQEYRKAVYSYLNRNIAAWHKNIFSSRRNTHGVQHALLSIGKDLNKFLPTPQNIVTINFHDYGIDVKERLYRFITKTLSALAFFYGISENNNFKRIAILEEKGHISSQLGGALKAALQKTLDLRYKIQLHYYGSQKEKFYISGSTLPPTHPYEKAPYVLSDKEWEDVLEIFEFLNSLEKALELFRKNEGVPNPFATFTLESAKKLDKIEGVDFCHLKAQLYEEAHYPQQAARWYRQAIVVDPYNPEIRANFLSFLHRHHTYYEQSYQSGIDQGLKWIKQWVQAALKLGMEPSEYVACYALIPDDASVWQQAFRSEVQSQASGEYRKSIIEALSKMGESITSSESKGEAKISTPKIVLSEKLIQFVKKAAQNYSQEIDKAQAPTESILMESSTNTEKLTAHQEVLLTKKLTPKECTLLIEVSMPLLNSVQTERQEQMNATQVAADTELEKYIDLLIMQPDPLEKFVAAFKCFSSELQQKTLLVLQARWEIAMLSAPKSHASVTLSSSSSSTTSSHAVVSSALSMRKEEKKSSLQESTKLTKEFLELLLKELNKVCHQVESEHSLALRERWRETLTSLVDSSPYDSKESPVRISSPLITPLPKKASKQAVVSSMPLSRIVSEKLYDEKKDFRGVPISGSKRRVVVLTVETPSGPRSLHIKAKPEMPGMSRFIELMHEHFFGHGTSITELVGLHVAGQPVLPVLVSETIDGKNLDELFEELRKAPTEAEKQIISEPLQTLSHRHYSEQVLMAMLTNPEDGIPANYVVESIMVDGRKMHTLRCVDTDHALFEACSPQESKLSEPKVQVKTILFCFEQMHRPIDPSAREKFCKINIIEKLRVVLNDARVQNSYYEKLFDADTIRKLHNADPKKASTIPIPLKEKIIVKLYHKMLRMQQFLSNPENHNKTLLDCLLYIEPRVGAAYRKAFSEYHDPYSRLDAVGEYSAAKTGKMVTRTSARGSIHIHSSSSVIGYQKLEALSPEQSLAELNLMEHQSRHIEEYQKKVRQGDLRSLKMLKADEDKAAVIGGCSKRKVRPLRWEELSAGDSSTSLTSSSEHSPAITEKTNSLIRVQGELLKSLKGIPFINLHLAHCYALSGWQLFEFVAHSPDLVQLDLSNHPSIRFWDLSCLNNHSSLQVLVLRNMKVLDHIQDLDLQSLTTLIIVDAPQLLSIRINAPNLKYLHVENCRNLKTVEIGAEALEQIVWIKLALLDLSVLHKSTKTWAAVVKLRVEQCNLAEFDQNAINSLPFLVPLIQSKKISKFEIKNILTTLKQVTSQSAAMGESTIRKLLVGTLIFPLKEEIHNSVITSGATVVFPAGVSAIHLLADIVNKNPLAAEFYCDLIIFLLHKKTTKNRNALSGTLKCITDVNSKIVTKYYERLLALLSDNSESVTISIAAILGNISKDNKVVAKAILLFLKKSLDRPGLPVNMNLLMAANIIAKINPSFSSEIYAIMGDAIAKGEVVINNDTLCIFKELIESSVSLAEPIFNKISHLTPHNTKGLECYSIDVIRVLADKEYVFGEHFIPYLTLLASNSDSEISRKAIDVLADFCNKNFVIYEDICQIFLKRRLFYGMQSIYTRKDILESFYKLTASKAKYFDYFFEHMKLIESELPVAKEGEDREGLFPWMRSYFGWDGRLLVNSYFVCMCDFASIEQPNLSPDKFLRIYNYIENFVYMHDPLRFYPAVDALVNLSQIKKEYARRTLDTLLKIIKMNSSETVLVKTGWTVHDKRTYAWQKLTMLVKADKNLSREVLKHIQLLDTALNGGYLGLYYPTREGEKSEIDATFCVIRSYLDLIQADPTLVDSFFSRLLHYRLHKNQSIRNLAIKALGEIAKVRPDMVQSIMPSIIPLMHSSEFEYSAEALVNVLISDHKAADQIFDCLTHFKTNNESDVEKLFSSLYKVVQKNSFISKKVFFFVIPFLKHDGKRIRECAASYLVNIMPYISNDLSALELVLPTIIKLSESEDENLHDLGIKLLGLASLETNIWSQSDLENYIKYTLGISCGGVYMAPPLRHKLKEKKVDEAVGTSDFVPDSDVEFSSSLGNSVISSLPNNSCSEIFESQESKMVVFHVSAPINILGKPPMSLHKSKPIIVSPPLLDASALTSVENISDLDANGFASSPVNKAAQPEDKNHADAVKSLLNPNMPQNDSLAPQFLPERMVVSVSAAQGEIPESKRSPSLTEVRVTKLIDNCINERIISLVQLSKEISPIALLRLLSEMDLPQAANILFRPIHELYKDKPQNNPQEHAQIRFQVLKVLCRKLSEEGGVAGKNLLRNLLTTHNSDNAKNALQLAAQVDYGSTFMPYLLELSSSLGITNYVDMIDHPELGRGYAALHIASEQLELGNIQALLKAGANPTQLSQKDLLGVHEITLRRVNNKKSAQVILIWLRHHSPKRLEEYAPYADLVRSRSGSEEADEALIRIIHLKSLLDVAKSSNSMVRFAYFVNTAMLYFPDRENLNVRTKFFEDFVKAKEVFLKCIISGYLNADDFESHEAIKEMVVHLMDTLDCPDLALAIYQRLLSEQASEFTQSASEIFLLAQRHAICIAKIRAKDESSRFLSFWPFSEPAELSAAHQFKVAVEAADGIAALVDVLNVQANKANMLPAICADVRSFLIKYKDLFAAAKQKQILEEERRKHGRVDASSSTTTTSTKAAVENKQESASVAGQRPHNNTRLHYVVTSASPLPRSDEEGEIVESKEGFVGRYNTNAQLALVLGVPLSKDVVQSRDHEESTGLLQVSSVTSPQMQVSPTEAATVHGFLPVSSSSPIGNSNPSGGGAGVLVKFGAEG